VKTKPSYVVLEDLNISGMMKNKHLSKAIQQQSLYEFGRQIKYNDKSGFLVKTVSFDNSYITLVTCTPPGTTWKRLVIRASLDSIISNTAASQIN